MLDKKEVSKTIDMIILHYGEHHGKRGELLDDLLTTLLGFSKSIDNGHFDVKELIDAG